MAKIYLPSEQERDFAQREREESQEDWLADSYKGMEAFRDWLDDKDRELFEELPELLSNKKQRRLYDRLVEQANEGEYQLAIETFGFLKYELELI